MHFRKWFFNNPDALKKQLGKLCMQFKSMHLSSHVSGLGNGLNARLKF